MREYVRGGGGECERGRWRVCGVIKTVMIMKK